MKITFAMNNTTGSGYYRCFLPAWALKLAGHDVRCGVYGFADPLLYESDLVILHRQVNSEAWLRVMAEGMKRGCRYAYSLDDSLDVPTGHPYEIEARRDMMGAIALLWSCNAAVVSTEPLARMAGLYNKNVVVLPNFIEEPTTTRPAEGGPVRVGFAGSSSHCVDFTAPIKRALIETKERYGDRIQLVFLGFMPEEFTGLAEFYRGVPVTGYIDTLNSLRFDIGIAPCIKHGFNHAKSNLKFLEYSVCGAATIASPVYPYIKTVQSGYGRVLRGNSKSEWKNALSRYIEDESLRKCTALNARSLVSRNYLVKDKILAYLNIFERIASGKEETRHDA